MTKTILRFSLLIGLLSLSCGTSFAQVKTGLPTFGSFSGGPDAINLANLNIHLTLPIVSKPGRGLPFVYNVGYDSSIWSPQLINGNSTWTPASNWGFTLGLPAWNGQVIYNSNSNCTQLPAPYNYELCTYTADGFAYVDANGTEHPTTYSWEEVCNPGCQSGSSGSLLTTDDSGYTIAPGGGAVTDRSGTLITTASGTLGTAGSIEDTNGNYISANTSGSNIVLTDTVNQTPLTISSSNTLTIPTGTATLYYMTEPVATDFGCSGVAEFGPKSENLLYMIQMPDGSAYTFQYEQSPGGFTGRISSVGLPSGERITYTYGPINCSDGSTTTLTRVTSDNSSWSYSRSGSQTTVTAPTLSYDSAGNQTVYTFDANGHETERQIYQGTASGTPIETVSTTWDSNDVAPVKTVTTLAEAGGSATSEVDTSYDSYGNLTSKTEYGWGSGGTAGSIFRVTNYTFNNSYGGIADLLTDETISNGSTVGFRKHIDYDQSQITNCPSGVPQHDDTNYSCTSSTDRGNPTTVTTYTNPAGQSGGMSKTFSYDMFGNEISAQLNCCQQKTWSYSSTTDYALPDSVTSGTSPQLTTKYSYNLSTGSVSSVMDPNNLATNYQYNSTTGQLSSISYPDGNSASMSESYGGSEDINGQNYSWPTTRTEKTQISPGQYVQKTTTLDSMGRPADITITDGDSTSNSVSYGYDVLGRRWETSNPFTGTSFYWTKSQFDALGRPTATVLPDGEQTLYSYSIQSGVPTVTITDPTGKQRQVQSDPAGRAIAAFEPDPSNNNSLTLETQYTYDVLDDLTQVSQGGQQTRSYSYDGVGRLLSAALPESNGTATTYAYDNFDNLTKRIDPRGVETDYHYDGLNRLLGITYPTVPQSVSAMPDNVCTTQDGAEQANVCLYYDQGGANAYALGKLTEMTDPSGSESYTYDDMGRETQMQKVFGSATYTIGYQYNYAGEITQMTYPSGHQVTPAYDSVGRLASLTGNLGGTNATYASGFTYDTAQHVTQLQYGNGIYGSFGFSPDRLQLTCLDYSKTNRNGTCAHDGASVFGLDYSYSQNGNNDGEITGITDDVDSGRSVTYTYDALARLTAATTVGSSKYAQWGLSWKYDQFGNRTEQDVTAGSGPSNCLTISPTTNRITDTCSGGSGIGYDSNGNMINDGQNTLLYDGEDRLTSSSGSFGSAGYVYDGNGLRVEKCVPNCTTPSSTTVYVYSGSKVIAEYPSGSSTPSVEYVYSGSQLLAAVPNGGNYDGSPAQGSATVAGSEQSVQGTQAASGTGNVTFSGTLQSKQVQTQTAAAGTGTVTISGSEQSQTVYEGQQCYDYPPPIGYFCIPEYGTVYDSGTASVTVNGIAMSTSWGENDTSSTIASALASVINGTGASPVIASVSGSTITLTAKYTGASTNYSLSASVTSQYGSFAATPSGSTLTGGRDNEYQTIYDSGTSTITINGTHSDSYSWSGSGTTAASIASDLASAINGDSGSLVSASASGSTVYLTAKVTGASTNYSLSSSSTYDSGDFSSPSFGSSNSGATLTGGQSYSPTLYDSGTVSVTINGTAYSASYGQGSTLGSVADALASAINGGGAVVTASVYGSSITLTATTSGENTNYSLSASSSTDQPGSFSQPSFSISVSGANLGWSSATYYLSDQVSNRMLTDSNGDVIGQQGDYPYGESWYNSGGSSDWVFSTYQRDAESNNDYAMAREYVNRYGRFSALDPASASILDPQSMNRYSYAGNDPINNVDPSGQDFMTDVIVAQNTSWWDFTGLGDDEFSFLDLAAEPTAEVLNETDWYYDLSSGFATTLMYWDTTINSVSYIYGNSAALGFVAAGGGAPGGTPGGSPAPAVSVPQYHLQVESDCLGSIGREIIYALEDQNNKPVSNMYVTEHQTNHALANGPMGPGTSTEPTPPYPTQTPFLSEFDDTIGGLKDQSSYQTFTVSPDPPGTGPSFPAFVRNENGNDYGTNGIWIKKGKVFINGKLATKPCD